MFKNVRKIINSYKNRIMERCFKIYMEEIQKHPIEEETKILLEMVDNLDKHFVKKIMALKVELDMKSSEIEELSRRICTLEYNSGICFGEITRNLEIIKESLIQLQNGVPIPPKKNGWMN